MLVVAFVVEASGLYPRKVRGRHWGLGAGVLSGVIGGAVGLPGPPVVLYAAMQGWSARAIKANLQAFFVVNQGAILAGYWWAGLLTREVWSLTVGFALPAVAGAAAGALLFERVGCSCAADRGADYLDCVAFHCSMLFSIWRAWPSR